jgi:hypothetical protein
MQSSISPSAHLVMPADIVSGVVRTALIAMANAGCWSSTLATPGMHRAGSHFLWVSGAMSFQLKNGVGSMLIMKVRRCWTSTTYRSRLARLKDFSRNNNNNSTYTLPGTHCAALHRIKYIHLHKRYILYILNTHLLAYTHPCYDRRSSDRPRPPIIHQMMMDGWMDSFTMREI